MKDPVLAADGYCYERKAIAEWIRSHKTSPMSNQVLNSTALIPNNTLRFHIREMYPGLV